MDSKLCSVVTIVALASLTARPSDGVPMIKDLPAATRMVADSAAAESSSAASICKDKLIDSAALISTRM